MLEWMIHSPQSCTESKTRRTGVQFIPATQFPRYQRSSLSTPSPPPGHINESTLQTLIKAADVKKVPPKVKGRRRFRDAEKPLSGLDVESLFRLEKRGKRIDPANAVPEFKQMLDLADDETVIPDAVRQMTAIVEDQIRNSFGDSRYQPGARGYPHHAAGDGGDGGAEAV